MARERRLAHGEETQLMDACAKSRNIWLSFCVQSALKSGMRRGGLLALAWADLDLDALLCRVRTSKNGEGRWLPLTSELAATWHTMPRAMEGHLFSISPTALRQAWVRTVARAGIRDLRFHDLRHEAITRFFEKGLSIPEVALISGHKDVRQLFRHTHLRAIDLVTKL